MRGFRKPLIGNSEVQGGSIWIALLEEREEHLHSLKSRLGVVVIDLSGSTHPQLEDVVNEFVVGCNGIS